MLAGGMQRLHQDMTDSLVKAMNRRSSIWQKWDPDREALVRAAARCWIPIGNLRAFFNEMPGPSLTETDVVQRLLAIHEEAYTPYSAETYR